MTFQTSEMFLSKSVKRLFQPSCKLLRASKPISCRSLTHYPIDDVKNGLTEDERQLRETAFNFCQKELAPLADKISASPANGFMTLPGRFQANLTSWYLSEILNIKFNPVHWNVFFSSVHFLSMNSELVSELSKLIIF